VLSQIEQGQKLQPGVVKKMIQQAKVEKRTPREKNARRGPSDHQYDGRPAHPQPESLRAEQRQLREERPIGAEQAAATDELIKLLVAWDRFDEFTALLKEADISSFVQALRDHSSGPDIGAINDPWAGHPGLIPFVSPEAVPDNTADDCVEAGSEAAPPRLQSASSEMPVHERSDDDERKARLGSYCMQDVRTERGLTRVLRQLSHAL
jgi:hypothetical protein